MKNRKPALISVGQVISGYTSRLNVYTAEKGDTGTGKTTINKHLVTLLILKKISYGFWIF